MCEEWKYVLNIYIDLNLNKKWIQRERSLPSGLPGRRTKTLIWVDCSYDSYVYVIVVENEIAYAYYINRTSSIK